MAYIDTTPIIPNTTMQMSTYTYFIAPAEGYVLHDNRNDYPSFEDETIIIEGYTRYGVTVPLNYDFEANPFNIYAVLESEVPADQIFGGNEPEHEVM